MTFDLAAEAHTPRAGDPAVALNVGWIRRVINRGSVGSPSGRTMLESAGELAPIRDFSPKG